MEIFSQGPFRCRLEWGAEGAERAAGRGNIIVIVDTLSFSTAVATAVHRGGLIYPCGPGEDPVLLARRVGGEAAVNRREVPSRGRFSLSPGTFESLEPGTRVVLASPNGAVCARAAGTTPWLFAGALVNSRAVAEAVGSVMESTGLDTTIIPCGERWETTESSSTQRDRLRVAIEDYLGAGAILSHLSPERSPEAEVCAAAHAAVRGRLPDLIRECASGRELRAMGFDQDVARATQIDTYDSVPVLRRDRFERWTGSMAGAGSERDDVGR